MVLLAGVTNELIYAHIFKPAKTLIRHILDIIKTIFLGTIQNKRIKRCRNQGKACFLLLQQGKFYIKINI